MQALQNRHIVACAIRYQALPGDGTNARIVMQKTVRCLKLAVVASGLITSGFVRAQSPGTPSVVTGGANGVTFNGKPAAVTISFRRNEP